MGQWHDVRLWDYHIKVRPELIEINARIECGVDSDEDSVDEKLRSRQIVLEDIPEGTAYDRRTDAK